MVKLLEPFAIHTDQLQSDSQSRPKVECHAYSTWRHTCRWLLLLGNSYLKCCWNPCEIISLPFLALIPHSLMLHQQQPACWIQVFYWFVKHQTRCHWRGQQSLLCRTWQLSITTSQDTVITTQTAAESPPTVLQKYFLPCISYGGQYVIDKSA